MHDVKPFIVMQLLARARQLEAEGRSVVHMEIGEPDFVTPEPIVRAGHEALARGLTHYTPALGLPELRVAVADHYRRDYGIAVSSERIVITPGSSGALQLITNVVIDPGDEVLLADPGYPCNRNFVRLVGGIPVPVPVDESTSYQLTAEGAERLWSERTRAILVASPSNPTGTIIDSEELLALRSLARSRGAVLIVDEIYHGLVYGEPAESALSLGDDVFVINSFSKFFGMTGWRLGWLVSPGPFLEPIDRLAQNIFLSAPTIAQHAALAAFQDDTANILETRRREFQLRRDYLVPVLSQLGFRFGAVPQGAFYLYADCSALTDDSFRFANDLLERAAVAVTPGADFGDYRAKGHLRFAYTTGLDRLQQGVDRIRAFIRPA
jgi:aspartate/methionine/tyrosine aminotransferase